VNPDLISGLSLPVGIAVFGSDLFVANAGNYTIGEYTTAGTTINPALISAVNVPQYIALGPAPPVAPVPEPSSLTLTLLGLVLAGMGFRGWRKRVKLIS
jgi:PEP-CTERM motif